jgi:hypothetical protein
MWIRAARLRLGLRQSDVARLARVSAESASRSERGGLDVKRRIVPGRFRAERGWMPGSVGVVLVLPENSTERDFVSRFQTVFNASLHARNVAVRKLAGRPRGRPSRPVVLATLT